MTSLESLVTTINQVLPTNQPQLPNYPVEPPCGTADLDGYLAA